jgi:hypothetical protein
MKDELGYLPQSDLMHDRTQSNIISRDWDSIDPGKNIQIPFL